MNNNYTKFEDYYDDLFNPDVNKSWKVDDTKLVRLDKDKNELYFYNVKTLTPTIRVFGFNWLVNIYLSMFSFTLVSNKQLIDLNLIERFKLSEIVPDKVKEVKYVMSFKNETKHKTLPFIKEYETPPPIPRKSKPKLDHMTTLAEEWDLRHKRMKEEAQNALDIMDAKLRETNKTIETNNKVKEKLQKRLKERMNKSISMRELAELRKILE
jgi:hypothetical protein